ncbi:MAG: signal peptidase I [Nitrospirae bacterium]|nr:signal peptidase I [Nitrospirota bacterium]
MEKAKSKSKKHVIREYIESILIAVVMALIIKAFIVQAFKIPSGSMIPTLKIGDHILVNKFIYGVKIPFTDRIVIPFKMPQRGDIIVFKFPEDEKKDFIKRVVGLPGDTLEIKEKMVYINGKSLEEQYAAHSDPMVYPGAIQPRDNYGPIVIPEDSYFAMGDNRDFSLDSRYWGFVKLNKIKGKAFIIYWSWDGEDSWVRWGRMGMLIK